MSPLLVVDEGTSSFTVDTSDLPGVRSLFTSSNPLTVTLTVAYADYGGSSVTGTTTFAIPWQDPCYDSTSHTVSILNLPNPILVNVNEPAQTYQI